MTFLHIKGHSIHYQYTKRAGERTFIFVNSLGTDFRIWDEVVEILQPHGSILRFDKPGHGLSEAPKNALTIADYVAMVVGLMDELQIETCVFIGLSIGGVIGQRFALMHPERIEKLVLSNTAPKIGTADGWNERIQTVQQQGMAAVSDGVLERWFPQPFRDANPTSVAGYRAMIEQTSPVGYNCASAAIRDEDMTNEIQQITLLTLVIGGTHDLATPPEQVQAMADQLPNATCHLIDGVGHIPCLQTPEIFAQFILDFMAEPTGLTRDTLYETGMKTRRAVLGDAHVDRAEANKTDFDADFQQYITENAWGSIWSRSGRAASSLTYRERSLITIALLAALGHEDELAMHIRATRNTGATPDDVKEALLHTGIYAGVPVTNGAMKIAKEIFADQEN